MLTIHDQESDNLDAVFSALSNKYRRRILHSLSYKPASIKQLAGQFDLSLPAIHRHIKVLEDAQLVLRKKSGRTNFLAISRPRVLLMQAWVAQYQVYWGSDSETLDNYIAHIEREK